MKQKFKQMSILNEKEDRQPEIPGCLNVREIFLGSTPRSGGFAPSAKRYDSL
jgi:hypothetical protein